MSGRGERGQRRAVHNKERRRGKRPTGGGGGGGGGGGVGVDPVDEFKSFSKQLLALGLKIREVAGDGNCLFRALGDQLDGDVGGHLKHREHTVEFMRAHRAHFEPFLEDDVPFERHVANLAKPGTFAGNDAIVAFARSHEVVVVIHQLNAPLWEVRGTDKAGARELHIAYRHGEHYDSVRRVGDNTHCPASLHTKTLSMDEENRNRGGSNHSPSSPARRSERDEQGALQRVKHATGCQNELLVRQSLEDAGFNEDTAIGVVLQTMEALASSAHDEVEKAVTSSLLLDDPNLPSGPDEKNLPHSSHDDRDCDDDDERRKHGARQKQQQQQQHTKTGARQKRENKRLDKKRRQVERHRQRVLGEHGNSAGGGGGGADLSDGALPVALTKGLSTLSI
ncbi:OTU domain-containing protein 3 isoform X2 [Petromyzon marinus]|uniref:OTU domain-containing protein 3 isoform X2 n=1 Tax=Petromyzon marinus TaxID=7757 RepID=UPI003F6E6993